MRGLQATGYRLQVQTQSQTQTRSPKPEARSPKPEALSTVLTRAADGADQPFP
jgi:hypothetical protein